MTLEQLMIENQEVLIRLKENNEEYYTAEQFLKDFEKKG